MSKYLSDECRDCYEYIEPYGCTDHNCPIYKGIKEYHADIEHDRLKDERMEKEWAEEEGKIHSIFDNVMKNIQGDL